VHPALRTVYTSARNALGLEGAKKIITFCFIDRAKAFGQVDFGFLLSVAEDEIDEGFGTPSAEQGTQVC
jgi:hypothetical protein